MRIRLAVLALLAMAVFAAPACAQGLDLKKYMPISEVKPGMTGIGKTTFQGSTIEEFQVKVIAVMKNVGPRRDLFIVRCSGAGLEESGVVAGMSGSPVYIEGRLIGAVAYAFPWCKVPIAGVQPIEQMLAVSDEHPWTKKPAGEKGSGALSRKAPDPLAPVTAALPSPSLSIPVAAAGLPDLPGMPRDRDSVELTPIRTPLMVSGLVPRVLERLRADLAPYGLDPIQGGAADKASAVQAKLEPGAPLAITLMRGDMEMSGMGTITEIAGDRLYAFGHAMFGLGEASYPLMTGIGQAVIPSLQKSFRMGAAVEEVGRLAWDEETAIFGRLGKERAPTVPVTVTVRGPDPGAPRVYHYQVIHHRMMSGLLAAMATQNSLLVRSELPRDHTVSYRVAIKTAEQGSVVHDNLAAGPDGDMQVQVRIRGLMALLMENPFRNLTVQGVEVEVQVEAENRLATIEDVHVAKRAVRPGTSVPVEVKVRPWRQEPRWMRINVDIPKDYPKGTYRLVVCGGDESRQNDMRDAPARFRPTDLGGFVRLLRIDERRDRVYVRLEAPGEGIAVGPDELPDLPPSMRSVLAEAARNDVTTLRGSRVASQPVPYVLGGEESAEIKVDEYAPE